MLFWVLSGITVGILLVALMVLVEIQIYKHEQKQKK